MCKKTATGSNSSRSSCGKCDKWNFNQVQAFRHWGTRVMWQVRHENELHVGPFQHANMQLIRMSLESPKIPNTHMWGYKLNSTISVSHSVQLSQNFTIENNKKQKNKNGNDKLGLRDCGQMARSGRLHSGCYIIWPRLACGVNRCSKDFSHGICCVNHISHQARHAHMTYTQFLHEHKFYHGKLFSHNDVIKIDIGILLIKIYKWPFCDIIRARQ